MSNKKEELLTTAEGVVINKRVEDGKTAIFTDQLKAMDHAKQKRSYVYWVYKNHTFYGYAVPK